MTLQVAPAIAPVDAASFEAVRPRLFGIAYRTLESVADADDVVQDAWIRWQGTDRDKVRDAAAFLATTTKRLALNVAQSARARRETFIEPWHPEQVDARADPTLGAERREAIELALRTLWEKLSPTERAAYVLREAFDYPYRQIARVLATSEANARQLVTRARVRLAGERRRQVSAAEQERFIDAFVDAAQSGDLRTLERLLAAEVEASAPVAIAA
jgi:RNA polymerase sigma-70 factor (ECF subfamily)